MGNKVFIIGNGFDLNLGWNTSYRSFIASDSWKNLMNNGKDCQLKQFLKNQINIDGWCDLEGCLRLFATETFPPVAGINDKLFYDELRISLTDFIRQEEKKVFDKNSMAAQTLKAVLSNGWFTSIYDFNYTDLNSVAKKIGVSSKFFFQHVHGCVENNSIILGIDDEAKIKKGFSFFLKVFSEHYRTHPIRYDLEECNEVVFFGHSLGDIDYPYFKDFFYTQSHCDSRKEGKRITIFTKDNSSRLQILEQLRRMNEARTERLLNDNTFNIIMTESPNQELWEQFLNHLHNDTPSKLISYI